LVNAILTFDGHVIAAMRTKTEWTTEKSSNGKSAPVRVGLAPEQGKGIEYEFDMLMEINPDHIAHVIKDRTGKYQDKLIEKPSEQLGQELMAWLSEGVAPKKEPPPPPSATPSRPYAPDVLRHGFDVKLKDKPDTPPTAGKRGATVGALNNLFTFTNASKEAATDMRHSLAMYLVDEAHSAMWTDAQCDVFLSWAQTTDNDGANVPHPIAVQEAARIVALVEQEQGQQQMEGI